MLGIDFGTTHARVAVVVGGAPVRIHAESGQSRIPSVVSYTPAGPRFGISGVIRAAVRPHSSVRSVKRLLGLSADHPLLHALVSSGNARVELDPDMQVRLQVGRATDSQIDPGVAPTPTEITRDFFAHLAQLAQQRLSESPRAMVCTAPGWFSPTQRWAMARAASTAGLPVKRVLTDAAAFGVALRRRGANGTMLVVDAGAGGTCASVVEVSPISVRVLSSVGQGMLGGDDVDWLILSDILHEMGIEVLERRELHRLRALARSIKHDLSRAPETTRAVGDFEVEYDTDRLWPLLDPLVEAVDTCVCSALGAADMSVEDVGAVYLLGGMSDLPVVQATVAELFERRVIRHHAFDDYASLGAAMTAAVWQGQVAPIEIEEFDLEYMVDDGQFEDEGDFSYDDEEEEEIVWTDPAFLSDDLPPVESLIA